ncbi:MAG TPA: DinB family protein [Cytophagales bacterium]|nr:DinB family protein [Cytophagales bacterium]
MISFAIDRIKYQLQHFPQKFLSIPEKDIYDKPFPNKWSKKEILGHLIDSATNNHHRFIRSYLEPGIIKIVPYDQEKWVELNGYQNISASEILNFWIAYNKHILNFITSIPEAKLNNKFDNGSRDLITLAFLINDYVDHMEHHITQILDRSI